MSEALLTARPKVARVSTALVFAVHAAVFAAWTPHIPEVKDRLGLNDGTLGLALLGAPVGSVIAMLAAGGAIAKWGSKRVVLLTFLAYALVSPALGFAPTPVLLFVSLAFWGGFQGALDVAMNSQGIAVETAYGRPILSSFHAWWSAGAFVGVGIGAVAVAFGVDLRVQMLTATALLLLAAWPLTRGMFGDDRAADGHKLGLPWRDRRVLLLGAIMFGGLLCEGAIGDWAAVYLRDTVGVPVERVGLGYAVFAVMMFLGRVGGDGWVARFGPGRVVGVLAALGGVSFGIALIAGQFWLALLGFALFGLGIACIVPVAFSSAAAQSDAHAGQAIAGVATAGWAGFLLGPPLIGLVSHATSLTLALAVLPLCCLGIAVAARSLRPVV